MGMTDKQFDTFLRILINSLREALSEEEYDKAKGKVNKILEDLQKALED